MVERWFPAWSPPRPQPPAHPCPDLVDPEILDLARELATEVHSTALVGDIRTLDTLIRRMHLCWHAYSRGKGQAEALKELPRHPIRHLLDVMEALSPRGIHPRDLDVTASHSQPAGTPRHSQPDTLPDPQRRALLQAHVDSAYCDVLEALQGCSPVLCRALLQENMPLGRARTAWLHEVRLRVRTQALPDIAHARTQTQA